MTARRARHDLADDHTEGDANSSHPPLMSIYNVLHRLEQEGITLPIRVPLTCCVDFYFIRAMYLMETRPPKNSSEPHYPPPLQLVKKPASELNSHVLLQEMVEHDWNRRLLREDLSDDDHPQDSKNFKNVYGSGGIAASSAAAAAVRPERRVKDFKTGFRERKQRQLENSYIDDMDKVERLLKEYREQQEQEKAEKQVQLNNVDENTTGRRKSNNPLDLVSKSDLARIDYELYLEQEQDYQGKHEEATFNSDNRFRDKEALKYSIWGQVAWFDAESERMNIEYLDSHGLRNILRNASSRKSRCVITQFLPPDDTAPPRNEMVLATFAGNFFRLERRANNHDYRDPTFSLNERGSCDVAQHSAEVQVPKVMASRIEGALKDLVQKLEHHYSKRVIVLRVAVKFRRGAVWLLHGEDLVFFDRTIPRMSDPAIIFAAGSPSTRVELRKRIKLVSRQNQLRANPQSLAQNIIKQLAEVRRRQQEQATQRRKEQDEAKRQFALKHGFNLTAAGIGQTKKLPTSLEGLARRDSIANTLSSDRLRLLLKQNRKEQRNLKNLGSFCYSSLNASPNTNTNNISPLLSGETSPLQNDASNLSPNSDDQHPLRNRPTSDQDIFDVAPFDFLRRRKRSSPIDTPSRQKSPPVERQNKSPITKNNDNVTDKDKMSPLLQQFSSIRLMRRMSAVPRTRSLPSSRRQSVSNSPKRRLSPNHHQDENVMNDSSPQYHQRQRKDADDDKEEVGSVSNGSVIPTIGNNYLLSSSQQQQKQKARRRKTTTRNLILGDMEDEVMEKVQQMEEEEKERERQRLLKEEEEREVALLLGEKPVFNKNDYDSDSSIAEVESIASGGGLNNNDDEEQQAQEDLQERHHQSQGTNTNTRKSFRSLNRRQSVRFVVDDDDNDDNEHGVFKHQENKNNTSKQEKKKDGEEIGGTDDEFFLTPSEKKLKREQLRRASLTEEEKRKLSAVSWLRAEEPLLSPDDLAAIDLLREAQVGFAAKRICQFRTRDGLAAPSLLFMKLKMQKAHDYEQKQIEREQGMWASEAGKEKFVFSRSRNISNSRRKSSAVSTFTTDERRRKSFMLGTSFNDKEDDPSPIRRKKSLVAPMKKRHSFRWEEREAKEAEERHRTLRQEQVDACTIENDRFWEYREKILEARVSAALRRDLLMHLKEGHDEF